MATDDDELKGLEEALAAFLKKDDLHDLKAACRGNFAVCLACRDKVLKGETRKGYMCDECRRKGKGFACPGCSEFFQGEKEWKKCATHMFSCTAFFQGLAPPDISLAEI